MDCRKLCAATDAPMLQNPASCERGEHIWGRDILVYMDSSPYRPNRENRQASIGLALRQNGCAVGITLNCAHGFPSQECSAENASTRACEKSQLT